MVANTPHLAAETWDLSHLSAYPWFEVLSSALRQFDLPAGKSPSIEQYNKVLAQLENPPSNMQGMPIRAVKDNCCSTTSFEEGYEPQIYLQGALTTRTDNWHDFFNFLVWMTFPKTKALLNAQQYQALARRHAQHIPERTPLENKLAHFDECGMVVLSTDNNILTQLREHRWQQVFWQQSTELESSTRFIIFGHGLYEKCLHPYIGMTGKALFLTIEAEYLQLDNQQQLLRLDTRLTEELSRVNEEHSQYRLYPLPLLGIPGWHYQHQDEAFYQNKDYFRAKAQ